MLDELAEMFGYMYDVALTGSLPPCGEGGQFALRIGRMRVIAEGDKAANDCLAAIYPHPSRRLCCYAKWKHSAIRQPSFKGNLSAQASRHLPHKGEGFRIAKRFCLTSGDSSTSLRMTAGGNGKAQTYLLSTQQYKSERSDPSLSTLNSQLSSLYSLDKS